MTWAALTFELMLEARRRSGAAPELLADARQQARHGMDAPDSVIDGVESYEYEDGLWGAVPRRVELRQVGE